MVVGSAPSRRILTPDLGILPWAFATIGFEESGRATFSLTKETGKTLRHHNDFFKLLARTMHPCSRLTVDLLRSFIGS